jgi:hypothetical protein
MRQYLLFTSTLLFVLLLIATIAIYMPFVVSKASQNTNVNITNETEALQVVSFKIVNRDLLIELKNIGDRPIIAYGLDYKSKKGVTVDLTNVENAFPPGSIHYLRIPINNLQPDEGTGFYKLNFPIAFFADGAAEGDWEQARIQREKLYGVALAAAQIQSKITSVRRFSAPAIERLSGKLSTIEPFEGLTKTQRVGYQSTVLQALVKMQVMLHNQSPEKAERIFNNFKNSLARQIAWARLLSYRRQHK